MLRMSLHKCMTRRLSHASLVNRLSRHSPCMSLRGNIVTVAISCLLFVLVACGDDNSDFATRPSDGSSSLSSSSAKSSGSVYRSGPCKVETDENCFKDDRDGQTYRTVQIGSQVWMAENLNYETDFSSCYKNVESNCAKYGRLYRWAAAVGKSESECGYGKICSLPSGNIQGVCPSGWHLPDTTEWYALFSAVGGQRVAGTKLKSTSGWYSSGNGTDAFSFSALPAGYRGGSYGIYNNVAYNAEFWSSTEHDSDYACKMNLVYDIDIAYLYCSNKDNEYSVRCLKDYDDESSSSVTPKSSSSSKVPEPVEESSSSTKSSSSSAKSNSSTKSSSSSAMSSSSVTQQSSSSETSVSSSSLAKSSSSVTLAIPCKTETEDNCEYGALLDDRDGQTYRTVKIGDQVWMAENLNYAYLQPTEDLDSSSFCFNDSAEYCEKKGRLYLWSAAMDSAGTWSANGKGCGYRKTCLEKNPVRGVCPEGWHLPTPEEGKKLLAAVGGQSTAGTTLKSTSGWRKSGNGTDDFGFSALPTGWRWYYEEEMYSNEDILTYFWCSAEYDGYQAYYMVLRYDNDSARVNFSVNKGNDGFSVRCVQD